MNVKRIVYLFRHTFLQDIKPPLGRWNFHNYRQTTLKIKYANEDNCGIACHDYTSQIKEINEQELDNQYMYSMGYESIPCKKVKYIK